MGGQGITSARQARQSAARDRSLPTVREAAVVLSDRQAKGFAKVAARIAKQQNIPLERAQAILAAKTRSASPAAKAKNPALKRVLPKKAGKK